MPEGILYGFFFISAILLWKGYLSAKRQPLPAPVPFLYRISVAAKSRCGSSLHRRFYDTFDNLKIPCMVQGKAGL